MIMYKQPFKSNVDGSFASKPESVTSLAEADEQTMPTYNMHRSLLNQIEQGDA